MRDDPVTVASILAIITDIVEEAVTWLTTTASAIAGNPIALCFILLPMMGAGIGLFRRIIHLN